MRRRTRVGLMAVAVVSLGLGATARAEVTTERSGSILVFPKVLADGTRDTIIQITNVSNSMVRAHCFYVNASLTDPTQDEGPLNPRQWQEVDFDIVLTKQQPTHWVVSQGRRVNPFDAACGPGSGVCLSGPFEGQSCGDTSECNITSCTEGDCIYLCSNTGCTDAGFDPGLIPPVVPGFEGELKCVEVDDSGAPLSGNHLKGEATLVAGPRQETLLPTPDEGFVVLLSGDESKYNALAVLGTENNGDETLVLGGGQCVGEGGLNGQICRSDEECGDAGPCAIEYNACPQTWILNHLADGAPNIVIEDLKLGADEVEYPGDGPSRVYTQLTVAPCTENFETQVPTSVTLQFQTWDEFESQFSASTTVKCWGNFYLSEIRSPPLTFAGTIVTDPRGTMYMQTRIRSAGGTPVGAFLVAEEIHVAKPILPEDTVEVSVGSAAAVNLHVEGERTTPDVITIPADQLQP